MAGDFSYQAKDVLKHLLLVASVRGNHSTGVAGINQRTGNAEIAKCVGGPHELFDYKGFERDISPSSQSVLIGHCRHATRGGINRHNAHPFEAGHIVGAHNGTLENVYQYSRDTDVKEHGTDSETLFNAIAKHGIVDAVAEAKGAWALSWWDGKDGTLNFLRNDKRPLWMCYSEDMKKIFWASEWIMLQFALDRTGVKLFKDDKGHRFFGLAENWMMTFKVPRNGNDKIELVNEMAVKGNEKPSYSAPFPGASTWKKEEKAWKPLVPPQAPRGSLNDQLPPSLVGFKKDDVIIPPAGTGTTSTSSPKSSTTPTTSSGNGGSTKDTPPSPSTLTLVSNNSEESSKKRSVVGPDGKTMSTEEFEKQIENGCQWCSQSLDVTDKVVWLSSEGSHIPLCETCGNPNSEFHRYMANG